MSDWKPIESAPKNGSRILLYFPKHDVAVTGSWVKHMGECIDGYEVYPDFYDWSVDDDIYIMDDPSEYPSHWLEIPELPK